ncbi:glycosyltransferase family 2 protein [Candidatus Saccharibacteria bacterium]|nr:glycosyltransferase family 2 protein [Candidatus Saccharibacteria bacterium]
MKSKPQFFQSISVVIPTYNAANWLPDTIKHINASLSEAEFNEKSAEIIIVNDGSSDDTVRVVKNIKSKVPLRLLNQQNSGRFLARKSGIEAAKHETTLLIDSRVHIKKGSLKFAKNYHLNHPDLILWNAHVDVAKKGNIYARFGEAIVFIGWRRYFANPRLVSYELKDFDYYPKGTTCFIAPKSVLIESIEWFEKTTEDIKYSSDDTLLLRHMNEKQPITVAPGFGCIYHSRSKLSQFIKHSYHRGKVFVDGFLRPGTRFFYPLISVYAFTLLAPLALVLIPELLKPLLLVAVIIWILEFVVAVLMKTPTKDALSLCALTPMFAIAYTAGLWWALLRKFKMIIFKKGGIL